MGVCPLVEAVLEDLIDWVVTRCGWLELFFFSFHMLRVNNIKGIFVQTRICGED